LLSSNIKEVAIDYKSDGIFSCLVHPGFARAEQIRIRHHGGNTIFERWKKTDCGGSSLLPTPQWHGLGRVTGKPVKVLEIL
jgi:hypothetical protein